MTRPKKQTAAGIRAAYRKELKDDFLAAWNAAIDAVLDLIRKAKT